MGYGAPEVVAEAVKDSRETLGRIKILCQGERLSAVDPRLRVSTNHNPRNEDPQRSSLVRTRLCLTVRVIRRGFRYPFTTQTMTETPYGVWGTRGGSGSGERQP